MATIQEQLEAMATSALAGGETAAQPAPQGRDEHGRFGKGNRGGPGNPFARQMAELRKAALNTVSAEDTCAIIEAMKQKAIQGDVTAAKLVLSYSQGKPTPGPDPDTLDQHEYKTHVKNMVPNEQDVVNISGAERHFGVLRLDGAFFLFLSFVSTNPKSKERKLCQATALQSRLEAPKFS